MFSRGQGLGNTAQELFKMGYTVDEILPIASGYMRNQAAGGKGVDVNTKESYWGKNVWEDQTKASLQSGYDKFMNPAAPGPTPQQRGQDFQQKWMAGTNQRNALFARPQQPPTQQAPTQPANTMDQQINALKQPQGLRPLGMFNATNMPKRW
jgi:hypothetical protein